MTFLELMRLPPPPPLVQLESSGADPVENCIGWAQNGAHGTNTGAAEHWLRSVVSGKED